MKTSSYATLPALMLLVAGASADSALAGEVYKCVDGGSTVYQDLPCPGHPDQAPRARFDSSIEGAENDTGATPKPVVTSPPVDPDTKQRVDLYTSLHQAEQDRDRVEQGYKAEVEASRQRNRYNQADAAAEVNAINQRWSAQAKEVEQRQQDLASQAQQLCPGSKEITQDGKCR
jgi:hypothetical protein